MKGIKNWVFATFILCFLVIIAGGIVRTTQSGMGCPDWPTCFGKWIPPTNVNQLPANFEKYLHQQDIDHTFNVYHTWIEYFNRLLGMLLGIFSIIQLALFYKQRKNNKIAFNLAIAFFVIVILTGLFGAIVVKLNLAHVSISVHLFFALLLLQVQLTILLTIKNKLNSIFIPSKKQYLIISFLIILIIQSILGTQVRMYVDDVSKILHYNQREIWLAKMPIAFLIHRTFSWFVLIASFILVWQFKYVPLLKNKVYFLTLIVIFAMLAGIVLFYANMPAFAQPLHLLIATFAITQCCSILFQSKRNDSNLK